MSAVDVSEVPFKRVHKTASGPKYACDCLRVYLKWHLCICCRGELQSQHCVRCFKAMEVGPPEDLEFITTADPPSSAHFIKKNQKECRECRKEWKRCDRYLEPFLNRLYITGEISQFTEEPPQIFQCLLCAGGIRGHVVIGEEGYGSHTPFGVG